MKLLIISHTPHYKGGQGIMGWGPTIMEIDRLATVFSDIVHVAPLHPDDPPQSALPYAAGNVRLHPVSPSGGGRLREKFSIIKQIPSYIRAIREELEGVDAVHVRCPANISLVALFMLALMRRPEYRWVKYAGNWQPEGDEPWSYALQRRLLRQNIHRGVVTVNGQWDDQPVHILPFFNPCLSENQVRSAEVDSKNKRLGSPCRLLFVGALTEYKGAGRTLEIAKEFAKHEPDFVLEFIGDGPDREKYEKQTGDNGLSGRVHFLGWLPKNELAPHYLQAHFILLPTKSEGWPKVLSEAMAFGTVPIAGAVSCIPQIISSTGAGSAIPYDDARAHVEAIMRYVHDPVSWMHASSKGKKAAHLFTYDHYLSAVRAMFRNAWGAEL